MLTLRVDPARGESSERRIGTDEEKLVIGRSSDCDLILDDRYLSRRHARILRRGEAWLVEDLGSRNGTLLNGRRIEEPSPLTRHDIVQLSASVLTVLDIDGAEPNRSASSSSTRNGTILRPISDLVASSEFEAAPGATAGELRRYASRLRLLNEVHAALSRPIELQDLLELILDRAFEQLQPEEGSVFLKAPDGSLRRVASKTTIDTDSVHLFSATLEREVVDKGLAALVLDTATDERFGDADSIMSSGVRSLVAAPFADPDGCMGMIALNSRLHRRQFGEDDLELLASLASVAALRIRNLALAEEAATRKKLEEEIHLARQIQIALLPRQLPEIPGFEVLGRNRPSHTVSGDFFEIIERRDGREYILLLADVSGKGVAAALLTASFEALAAGPIEDGLTPPEVCRRVSAALHKRTPPAKYATAWMGALETETGRLSWSNAGQMPPLIVRASGDVERLEASGVPIGLLPDAEYAGRETTLDPGDTLIAYTDGLTEAEGPAGEEFGLERLVEICRQARGRGLMTLADALERDLDLFTNGSALSDDRTLLLAFRSQE
ncbi:MAG: SpoIIE family protein phosphatase [Acidobacteriota bacterium]|nr:SpoIIE family protein phosphatase [Acidobacteriota bacterium]